MLMIWYNLGRGPDEVPFLRGRRRGEKLKGKWKAQKDSFAGFFKKLK